jgi:L-alanine-DL-glutamate epimerase-like enolase superfamily enzyme
MTARCRYYSLMSAASEVSARLASSVTWRGERGRLIVPHCWKTGVSISATAHLAFTVPHCPFIEYLPPRLCHERLRRELAREELELGPEGTIPLPTRPGLGVEVDWDVVRRYSVA